jgi:hypothetical protein
MSETVTVSVDGTGEGRAAFRRGVEVAVADVLTERVRQEMRWGEQNHPIVSLDAQRGYVGPEIEAARLLMPSAAMARNKCNREHKACRGTYAHILVEEVAELIEAAAIHGDASDEARAEAVQVAAVALAIVERIDRARAAKGGA